MNIDFQDITPKYQTVGTMGYKNMNEIAYLELLNKVAKFGEAREDRTGVGTRALFGQSLQINLLLGFPLLTTKYVSFKTIYKELLWILSGSTDNNVLKKAGVHIWDEWEDSKGQLGPLYGHQWRHLKRGKQSIDQIKNLLEGLKNDPMGRRHIVNSWNPLDLPDMQLAPCHCFFQCYVSSETDSKGKQYLDLQLYQRSADLFLGVPYNIASYSLLMYILGSLTDYTPRHLNIAYGDAHIYNNHLEQVKTQLLRKPLNNPTLKLLKDERGVEKIAAMSLEDYGLNDRSLELFEVAAYEYWEKIEAPVAI